MKRCHDTPLLRARRPLPFSLIALFLAASLHLRAASGVEIISGTNAPRRANIALLANGGKVEQINPVADIKFAANINDGYSTEWRAAAKQLPQDIVISFYGGRTATVDRVVIDTLTKDTSRQPDQVPREVEIGNPSHLLRSHIARQ